MEQQPQVNHEAMCVGLTKEEINVLLTLLEPSYQEAEDPGYELCQKLTRVLKTNKPIWWFSYYSIDQVYGGPEEGGWYYHTQTLMWSRSDSCLGDLIYQFIETADTPGLEEETIEQDLKLYGTYQIANTDRYGNGYMLILEQFPGQNEDTDTRRFE